MLRSILALFSNNELLPVFTEITLQDLSKSKQMLHLSFFVYEKSLKKCYISLFFINESNTILIIVEQMKKKKV